MSLPPFDHAPPMRWKKRAWTMLWTHLSAICPTISALIAVNDVSIQAGCNGCLEEFLHRLQYPLVANKIVD